MFNRLSNRISNRAHLFQAKQLAALFPITSLLLSACYSSSEDNKHLFRYTQDIQLANTSDYQINKFFALGGASYVTVEPKAGHHFDHSKILVSDLLSNHALPRFFEPKFKTFDSNMQQALDNAQIDIKHFELIMRFNLAHMDRYDSTKVIIPVLVRYKTLADDGQNLLFNQKQTDVVLTGFKEDPNMKKLKDGLNTWMNSHSVSFSFKNKPTSVVDFIHGYQDIDLPNNQDYNAANLLSARYKYLSNWLNFDTNNFTEFQTNDQNINDNRFVSKIMLSDQSPNSVDLYLRTVHTDTSLSIPKSKQVKFGDNDTIADDRVITITDSHPTNKTDLTTWLEQIAQLRLVGYLNVYNFNFTTLQKSNIFTSSKNNKVSFEVVKVLPTGDTRYANVEIRSISSNKEWNNITFTKRFGVPAFATLFPKAYQEATNNYQMFLPELTRNQLTQVPAGMRQKVGATLISGGYLDQRGIYTTPAFTKSLHYGEDVIVPAATPLSLPFKSKMIASYYLPTEAFALGIGTVAVIKVDKKDLKPFIDPSVYYYKLMNMDKVYFGFIHLEKSFLKNLGPVGQKNIINRTVSYSQNISPKSPKTLLPNEVFATGGRLDDNGGWLAHVHIEAYDGKQKPMSYYGIDGSEYFNGVHYNTRRYNKYDPNSSSFRPTDIKPIGVGLTTVPRDFQTLNMTTLKPENASNMADRKVDQYSREYPIYKQNDAYRYGLLNPNWFFQFANPNMRAFNLVDLYPELKKLDPKAEYDKYVAEQKKLAEAKKAKKTPAKKTFLS